MAHRIAARIGNTSAACQETRTSKKPTIYPWKTAVIPSTQPVCAARARIRIDGALALGLELIQNAGAKEKNSTSQRTHWLDEIGSPFRVVLSKAGRERKTHTKRPTVRNAK